MNKYPAWLNVLVLVVLMAGCLLALPNIYGSVPAVQIADSNGGQYDDARLEEFVRTVENRCHARSCVPAGRSRRAAV